MHTIIIQSAKLIFPGAEFHGQEVDVQLENGKITQVGLAGGTTKEGATLIDARNQILSPGLFDLNVNFGEPGLETKEDMQTGCRAAALGGVTGIALQPNTFPPLHSRSEISLIEALSKGQLVDVFPVGTVSKERKGESLAEIYDMKANGAVAFSDGNKGIQEASLMSRALLYCKGFDGLVMSFPQDKSLAGDTKMNEGVTSVLLGMKGNPNLAEEVMVSRDLFLAKYNDAKIHFSTISTQGSVELIRKAKAEGVKVTCDVAVHHLVLTDEKITSFDSNFKVNPPLRTQQDQEALLSGLKDGTIDAIVSQHTPHEIEYKQVEFETASFGMTGLQTLLSLSLKTNLPVELLIEKLAINPRKILNINLPKFKIGESANIILFNPEEKWIFDKENNGSKSDNSPFMGETLSGKVTFVMNNNQVYTF